MVWRILFRISFELNYYYLVRIYKFSLSISVWMFLPSAIQSNLLSIHIVNTSACYFVISWILTGNSLFFCSNSFSYQNWKEVNAHIFFLYEPHATILLFHTWRLIVHVCGFLEPIRFLFFYWLGFNSLIILWPKL